MDDHSFVGQVFNLPVLVGKLKTCPTVKKKPTGKDPRGLADYLSRLPTASRMAPSSGNWPVFNFEYNSSPLTLSSKQPPPEGISVKSLMRCLYSVRSLLVRLTAFGS